MKKITLVKNLLGSFFPLLVAAIFLNCSVIKAQNTVLFQDEIITMPNNISSFDWNSMPESAEFNDGYFGWIRFNQTPTQAIQNDFVARNLKLIEYYPDQTYLFYFPKSTEVSFLRNSGAISIIPVTSNIKKSSQIKFNNIDSYAMQGNNVLVTLEHYDFIEKAYVAEELTKLGSVSILEDYKGQSMFQIALPYEKIDEVAGQAFVKWLELIPPPAVKEDIRGRSIHRASNLDSQTPTGRHYTGAGVGVMNRDDGFVGPHIDFQGRVDNSATSTTGPTHGDGVGGIMAGAGNLDPTNKGMAAGSDMYVVQYVTSFLDQATTDLINAGTVQITNSSYGNGCNGGYTSVTRTVDEQTNTIPSLLHVFSAGNSGTSNCGYGAGAGWGNITGGHKQGKNVIATANTFFNGQLASSSSRGPAADGRIKPDITAHGQNQVSTAENNTYQTFGGTSGAAPGIAGVSAQLYEAYADLNGGAFPESALIKATLLNTANDYGNVGPDFSFGWGMVNGLRAAMLIEEGRYLDATVTQGANNNHSITVPANTTQVRFMVYWSDVAAAPGAAPALVNDLDLVVTDPTSATFQPWVLNTTPNSALLNLAAGTGVDRLNNVEQVLINNPAAGTYNINVAGFNVPVGPQKYYVVYEIITDGLTMTYPIGGERFVPATQETIHWDAVNAVNTTTLEFSVDNGATWTTMATLPPATRNYTWTVPNNVSGQCIIRATNGTLTDQSPENFSIAQRVTGVSIQSVCPTEATISWNAVQGATSYDVYVLGQKYMEVIGNSTTTSHTFPIADPADPLWFAVSAKGGNGWAGLRTNARSYLAGVLFNCVLAKDLSVSTINNDASDFQTICNAGSIIVSVDIQNDGTDPQTNFMITYQIGTDPVVQEMYNGTLASGASDTFSFATPVTLTANGANTLKVWTSLSGDEYVNNDEKSLDFFAQVSGTSVDFLESFEVNPVLPEGWVLDNPDGARTWQGRSNVIGADGSSTTAAFVDGANYSTRGEEDTFTTEYFDLNFNGTAELKFDLAKAQWSAAYNDGLRVEVSVDCGATYTQIYFKDGTNLATVPNVNAAWVPNSATNWRTEVVDLTPYVGNDILLRFVNINDYSNSTFVDNISIESTLSVGENALESAISMYPNPAKSNVDIIINTTIGNTYEVELLNSLGQSISKIEETRFSARAQQRLDVSAYGTGLYFVKIKVGDQVVTKKLIVN
ncbi:S8 family serine peptidase [Kordia jejudonensis]|uniref:S8 family serine peptidase n=1 Tax=Kordia jejudonensis TaxID=1348245 RepID=UPI00062990AD|nr:S8 family serine peptidase [Kordia jejudonensis]